MSDLAKQIYGDNLEPQLPVDAVFLNRYSDVMREDMERIGDIVLDTRDQPIVRSFIDKVGMYREPGTERIQFNGVDCVGCRDVDILKSALLMAGRQEESFRESIDRVRTQYAGLFYYHLRLLELEQGEGLCEGLELMREMNRCDRYPVRIYQDREMMDTLLDLSEDFKDVRKVFNFMIGNKYIDSNGEEKLVCVPDDFMFNAWLDMCRNAKHYKKMHQTILHINSDYTLPSHSWFMTCSNPEDFEYFVKQVIEGNIEYEITVKSLLRWVKKIKTYSQLSVFMECLVKIDIEPDARLFSLIARLEDLRESGGVGPDDVRDRFRDLYTAEESTRRVTSPAMTRMYELVTARL